MKQIAFGAVLLLMAITLIYSQTSKNENTKKLNRANHLKRGCSKMPPNVEYWHAASLDTDLQQLYMLPNTEKGS